ncbi:MAG: hypothetical protein RBU23_04620 [Candidatus Auribacterota bacterium]|nr:hypothetical protein [Candidatus Auribacterota bacterium]
MFLRTKYFYFLRGTLSSHVHFYKGWVDAAREHGLPINMVTVLPDSVYAEQIDLVEKFSRYDYFHILRYKKTETKQRLINLFFGWYLLLHKKVIVQLKKQDINQFDTLKKIFKDRLKCIIELEGDAEAEKEYLVQHAYKEKFYDQTIRSMDKGIARLPQTLKKADHIFVLSDFFKETLCGRYPELSLREKISTLSTGVDCGRNYYSPRLRTCARRELNIETKFAMTFIGNVFYSWQNISRTIEIFSLIKRTVAENAYLILLVPDNDHSIAQEFLNKYDVKAGDYLLKQVDYDQIAYYLNAADIGFLLRSKHTMNQAASPGKFGDYTACGLPVIMTEKISDFSDMISQTEFCAVLDDMDDDDEVIRKIKPFLMHDDTRRQELSQWAVKHVSIQSRINIYIQTLKSL